MAKQTFNYSLIPNDWQALEDIINTLGEAIIDESVSDVNYILSDGSVDFAANQSMGGYKLTNLAEPIADTDAANKLYVDSIDLSGFVPYLGATDDVDLGIYNITAANLAKTVEQYGEIGVGNDTAVIQAALNDLGRGEALYFTSELYTVNAELYIEELREGYIGGIPDTRPRIVSTSTTNVFRVGSDTNATTRFVFSTLANLYFICGTAKTMLRITGKNTGTNTFENIDLEGGVGADHSLQGIVLTQRHSGGASYYNRFNHILIEACDYGMVVGYDFNTSEATVADIVHNSIDGMQITDISQIGLYLYGVGPYAGSNRIRTLTFQDKRGSPTCDAYIGSSGNLIQYLAEACPTSLIFGPKAGYNTIWMNTAGSGGVPTVDYSALTINSGPNELWIDGARVSLPQLLDVEGATLTLGYGGANDWSNSYNTLLLNPNADYALTSTPTIPDGILGQHITLMVGNAEPNTVTLQDESVLANSNLKLGAATRTIQANKILELIYDGTKWVELAYSMPLAFTLPLQNTAGTVALNYYATNLTTIVDGGLTKLNTIQNIDTTATPQFAQLGIGISPFSFYGISNYFTYSGANSTTGGIQTVCTDTKNTTHGAAYGINFGITFSPALGATANKSIITGLYAAYANPIFALNANEPYSYGVATFRGYYNQFQIGGAASNTGQARVFLAANFWAHFPAIGGTTSLARDMYALYDAGQDNAGVANAFGLGINTSNNYINGSLIVGIPAVAYSATSAVNNYGNKTFVSAGDAMVADVGSLGAEKLTNGTFTGNANGWTLNTGWAYSSNTAAKNADGTGTLTQAAANMVGGIGVISGEYYRLKFTLKTATTSVAGTVIPACGGVTFRTETIVVPTAAITNTVITTHIFRATSTADLTFTPSNTSRFSLDDISLMKITSGNLSMAGALDVTGADYLELRSE